MRDLSATMNKKFDMISERARLAMANIVHRLISGVFILRPEPAVSSARGIRDKTFPLALIAFLLAVCLIPAAHAATPMHNSTNIGSSKWSGDGGWGVANGKYGEFKCTTCHEPGASNVKRIKSTITVPDTSKGNIPGSAVVFQNVTSMGNDAGGHATSQRVCEVCHSASKYHNYDTTNNTGGLTHNNLKDCTSCHPHSKGFAAAGCDNCHGNPPTTDTLDPSAPMTGLVNTPAPTGATSPGPKAGGHLVHNNRGYACAACHSGNTMPTVSYTIQMGYNFYGANRGGRFSGYTAVNGYSFVSSNAGTVVSKGVGAAYSNTCSDLYCHGGGDSVNAKAALAGGTNKVPSWVGGSSQATCGTCHGITLSNYTSTGSHDRHMNPTQMAVPTLTCSKCHGVTTGNAHVDGSVFWELTTSWSRIGGTATYNGSASNSTGALAPSSSFGTCNSFYCHSDGNGSYPNNPAWGGSLASNCLGCHGGARGTASPINTYAHRAHINNYTTLGGSQAAFTCDACHAKTASSNTTVSTAANHVNVLKDYSGVKAGGSSSYVLASKTCNNSYCHSSGKKGSGGNEQAAPTWNGAALDCKGCHGGTAGQSFASQAGEPNYASTGVNQPGSNSHFKHVAPSSDTRACATCHRKTVDALNANRLHVYSTAHLNKVMDVSFNATAGASGTYNSGKTCSNTYCHGTGPSVAWGGTTDCTSCHEARNNVNISTRHDRHINTSVITTFTNVTSSNRHGTGDTLYVYGCKNCHTAIGDHATGPVTANTQDARIQQPADARSKISTYTAGGSVSTDGKGYEWTNGTCTTVCHSKDGTAVGLPTVSWTTAFTGSCSACHGAKGSPAANFATGTVHVAHMNNYSTNTSVGNCNACHATTAASNTAIQNGAQNQHPNQVKNTSGNAWVGSGSFTNSNCANTYCHDDGTAVAGSHVSISWTSPPAITCASCHGGNRTSGGMINTYAHAAHINYSSSTGKAYIGCAECHGATAASDTTTKLRSVHVNQSVNIKFAAAYDGDSPTYNATATTGATGYAKAVGNPTAQNTCANMYCHSEGNVNTGATTPTFKPIAWNAAAIGCDGCHGGSGKSHPWYASGAAGSATANSHVKHVEGSGIACVYCHENTTKDTAVYPALPTKVIANGNHLDRYEDWQFKSIATKTGTYDTGAKTCSTTYCHGTGPSVAWGGSTNCGSCHDSNNSLSNRHDKHYNWTTTFWHMTGLNKHTTSTYVYGCKNCHPTATHATGPQDEVGPVLQDAQINGTKQTSGNYVQGGSPNTDARGFNYTNGTCTTVCHTKDGVAAAPVVTPVWNGAFTGGCGVCHNKRGDAAPAWSTPHTVHLNNYSTNTTVSNCNSCHDTTAASNTALQGTAQARNQHPDQVKNAAFNATVQGTWSGTQCQNTYCHSDGTTTGSPTHGLISWSGTMTCGTSCHSGTGLATGTHAKHVNNAAILGTNYTCDDCHYATALNNTTIKTRSSHINLTKNVAIDTAQYGASATAAGSPVTCSNTRCHGTTSPTWGTANADNTLCTKCHGTLAVYGNISAATIAPGMDTARQTGTADAQVGFHQAHLIAASNYTKPIGCRQCHTLVTSVSAAGHIDSDLPSEITWGTLATTDLKGGNPATSYSAGTCSNVYCHDYTRFKNAWGADAITNRTPQWNVSLFQGLSATDKCKKCHGYPPAAPHSASLACNGCHTHVNATNDGFTVAGKPLHMNGVVDAQAGESAGGAACGACHSDLYNSTTAAYSMHSNVAGINYKHYMDNDAATYNTTIPDGTGTNVTSRKCTMCHVDHDKFKVSTATGAGRAFNLRPRADVAPGTYGVNRDTTLCLSCHNTAKGKYVVTPNGMTTTAPVPFQGLGFNNATSMVYQSTHSYAVYTSIIKDATLGDTRFGANCAKCHNDTISRNGETGSKSSVGGQDGYYKFGRHLSTVNSSFAIMSNSLYQGTAGSAAANSITVSPSPTWAANQWVGYDVVVTSGTGTNQRRKVASNTVDTVTVATNFTTTPAAGDKFDIVLAPTPYDNLCFSCHSNGGQDKPAANDGKDWYGYKSMKSNLENIKDVFVGDYGSSTPGGSQITTITLTTTRSWGANALVGYVFKFGGGSKTLTANTASTGSGPYSTNITWVGKANVGTGSWKISKPSSHPLDAYGRHNSYERVVAPAGPVVGTSMTSFWNKGDGGTETLLTGTSSVTTITDSAKAWTANAFQNMTAVFPSKGLKKKIDSNTATGITWTGAISLDPGEPYYIGKRHVACADCHNTHAAAPAARGTVTSGTANTLVATASQNMPGWTADKWKGYLIKLRKATGLEQIRFVSAFNQTTGTYTVALAWGTNPVSGDTFEVLSGDKWTAVAVAQDGGQAGTGSTGTWGVTVSGWSAPATPNLQNPNTLTYTKVENVATRDTAKGGSATTGQRDLCIKCHSYYSFKTSLPSTPSNGPGNVAGATTDIAAEFNPNNASHHAVYARGNNQPIRASYAQTGITSYMNPNWPIYATASDTVTLSSGTATFGGAAQLPRTALPGWYIYIGSDTRTAATGAAGTATTGYLEITSITSPTSFTVRAENGAGGYTTAITFAANANWYVTSGLGNNFIPPYGPWSILLCTDCHGSTKTDPLGPHASANRWLLKDLDTGVQFEWWNGTSVATITPNTGGLNRYFCFNCHRKDVYGDTATYGNYPRMPHNGGLYSDDSRVKNDTYMTANWQVFCRHCHAGNKLGGTHGTNLALSNVAKPVKRFLNGATWSGYNIPTTSTAITCYTYASGNEAVSTCASHPAGKAGGTTATYNYTW